MFNFSQFSCELLFIRAESDFIEYFMYSRRAGLSFSFHLHVLQNLRDFHSLKLFQWLPPLREFPPHVLMMLYTHMENCFLTNSIFLLTPSSSYSRIILSRCFLMFPPQKRGWFMKTFCIYIFYLWEFNLRSLGASRGKGKEGFRGRG